MPTVEELKESLLISIGDYDRTHSQHLLENIIVAYINALISKAEERGERKERMRLWMERSYMPMSADERCVLIPTRVFGIGEEREDTPGVEERLEKVERFLKVAGGAVERALDTTDDYTVAQRWRQEFGKAWYEYRFGKKEDT